MSSILEILEYTGIESLGITRAACERYMVPRVKTRMGIKLGAVFSDVCTKLLSPDGGFVWEGDYDPNMGLFGQKTLGVKTNSPKVLCASDLEVLKLASCGVEAFCLAEPRATDEITLGILADNLSLITKEIYVWQGSSFGKRLRAMERFLLFLSSTKQFSLFEVVGSETVRPLVEGAAVVAGVVEAKEYKPWRPKGIIEAADIVGNDDYLKAKVGVPTSYEWFNEANGGAKTGEVIILTSGTGVGKTTIFTEMLYSLAFQQNQPCAVLYLEEKANDTLKRLEAIHFNVPVSELIKNPQIITPKQRQEFNRHPGIKNITFFNHFGSLDSPELFSKIEYMADIRERKYFFLDHISIVVSGMTSSKEGERKDLDVLMTHITTLSVAKDVGFFVISHLSNPDGTPHEEGGRVTLKHLRGSGALRQLAFAVYGGERDQQDPTSTHILVRTLKGNRWNNGITGPCGVLNYNRETGRLLEDTVWTPLEYEAQLDAKRRSNWKQRQGYSPQGGGKEKPKGNWGSNMKFTEPY